LIAVLRTCLERKYGQRKKLWNLYVYMSLTPRFGTAGTFITKTETKEACAGN